MFPFSASKFNTISNTDKKHLSSKAFMSESKFSGFKNENILKGASFSSKKIDEEDEVSKPTGFYEANYPFIGECSSYTPEYSDLMRSAILSLSEVYTKKKTMVLGEIDSNIGSSYTNLIMPMTSSKPPDLILPELELEDFDLRIVEDNDYSKFYSDN